MAGAPVGNINKKAGREWREALYRALEIKADVLKLNHRNAVMDLIAMQLVDAALSGEPWAMKEFGDRVDGKPEAIKDGATQEQGEPKRLVING